MSLPAACPAYNVADPDNVMPLAFGIMYVALEKFMTMCWRCLQVPSKLSDSAELCDTCVEELRAISPV